MFDPLPEGQHPSVGSILDQNHERIDEHLACSLRGPAAETDTSRAGSVGLGNHLCVEEQHHFPALGASALIAPTLVAMHEHGHIPDLLDTLEAWPGDAGPAAPAKTWAPPMSLSEITPQGQV